MKNPLILSASRRTDIPAFYSDWFINRLKEGKIAVENPYYKKDIEYSLEDLKFVVFWTKNAEPIIDKLHILDEMGIGYYFQYSVNPYSTFEPFSPKPNFFRSKVRTFMDLSEKIGKEKVIFRMDPLILSNHLTANHTIDGFITTIEKLFSGFTLAYPNSKDDSIFNLKDYTDAFVYSYLDIYGHIKKVMNDYNVIEWTDELQLEFAEKLSALNLPINVATCSEKIDLAKYGINKNKCIDPELVLKITPDKTLASKLGYVKNKLTGKFEKLKDAKDKGQRVLCGCATSLDIGKYDTCLHFCKYCYANKKSKETITNWNINFNVKSLHL